MNKYFDHLSDRSSIIEVKQLISDTLDHFNNNSLREFYNNIRKNRLFSDKQISILAIDIRESKIKFWYEKIKEINSFYLETMTFEIDVKNKKYYIKEFSLETEFGCLNLSTDAILYCLKDNKPDFHYYDVISIEPVNGIFKTFDMSDFSEYDFSIKCSNEINYLSEEYKLYKTKAVSTLKQLSLIANVDAEAFLDFIIFNKKISDNIIDLCLITNDTVVNFDLEFAKKLQLKPDFKTLKIGLKNE